MTKRKLPTLTADNPPGVHMQRTSEPWSFFCYLPQFVIFISDDTHPTQRLIGIAGVNA